MGGVCRANRLVLSIVAFVVLLRPGSGFAAAIDLQAPTPNQSPVIVLTAPVIGETFTAPATITVSATASDIDGAVTIVDFYAGATLIGSDASSPYSVIWSHVSAGTYSLTAVAHDNAGAATTAIARSITVAPGPNQAPTVSLTAPADGATFTAPATMTLSATAGDADGVVTAVDFYAGTTLIESDTTSPYSVTWSNAAAGTYSLTAVARDNDGATATSAARSVTVTPGPNQAPAVSLTAPANGATFTAPATMTISATASDTDGIVTVVEFYRDGATLIGSATTNPYSVTWSDVPAGSYQLTAVARDEDGGMTVSAAHAVTVNDPQVPGRAVFTASSNHDTAVDYYVIEIFPQGADPDGANPVVAHNIGKPPVVNGECEADIHAVIQSLPPGSYFGTVTAYGTDGSARSSPSSPFSR